MTLRGRSLRVAALTLSCLMMISACSIIPPAQTLDIYRLPETAGARPVVPAGDKGVGVQPSGDHAVSGRITLRISTPTAPATLSRDDIVVIPDGNVVSRYHGARWSDAVPELLQARLAHALSTNGRITVIEPGVPALADLELRARVDAFQVEYHDGKPDTHVVVYLWLVDTRSRKVVATHEFDDSGPTSADVPAVVQTFGLACDRLSQSVSDWLSAELRAF